MYEVQFAALMLHVRHSGWHGWQMNPSVKYPGLQGPHVPLVRLAKVSGPKHEVQKVADVEQVTQGGWH